jgi:hypothetical protein
MDDRIKIFLWPDLPDGWVAAHASQVAQLGFNDFSEAQVSDLFFISSEGSAATASFRLDAQEQKP